MFVVPIAFSKATAYIYLLSIFYCPIILCLKSSSSNPCVLTTLLYLLQGKILLIGCGGVSR
jgi:hypothetical protein